MLSVTYKLFMLFIIMLHVAMLSVITLNAMTLEEEYCEIKQQRRLFASADFYCEILSDRYIHKNGLL
jgi:hypothetical protein